MAINPIIDPSLNDDQKIKRLIIAVERLGRRSNKVVKALVTPYPISNSVSGDSVSGDILKYMFVGEGVISKGILWISPKPKNNVTIVLTLSNSLGSKSNAYNTIKQSLNIVPNMKVQSGDRLTVSLQPTNSDDIVTEAWIAFSWVPEIKETEVKQVLIEELEKFSLEQ